MHRRRLAVVLPYPDLGRHCLTVARVFGERCLAEVDYAYLWDDGIHVKIPPRAEPGVAAGDDGGAPDGRKELVAL